MVLKLVRIGIGAIKYKWRANAAAGAAEISLALETNEREYHHFASIIDT
jgi:hypothetical protein